VVRIECKLFVKGMIVLRVVYMVGLKKVIDGCQHTTR
jgi:hypothetical protein